MIAVAWGPSMPRASSSVATVMNAAQAHATEMLVSSGRARSVRPLARSGGRPAREERDGGHQGRWSQQERDQHGRRRPGEHSLAPFPAEGCDGAGERGEDHPLENVGRRGHPQSQHAVDREDHGRDDGERPGGGGRLERAPPVGEDHDVAHGGKRCCDQRGVDRDLPPILRWKVRRELPPPGEEHGDQQQKEEGVVRHGPTERGLADRLDQERGGRRCREEQHRRDGRAAHPGPRQSRPAPKSHRAREGEEDDERLRDDRPLARALR